MPCATFSGGAAGGPLPAGTVPGHGEDGCEQAGQRIAGIAGPPAAVRAAGVGGHVAADQAEHRGERDEIGVDAGQRGGTGGDGGDHVVHQQQRPCFLAGQGRGLAAQDAAGAADGLLQVQERYFIRPLLMPVKWKLSLA